MTVRGLARFAAPTNGASPAAATSTDATSAARTQDGRSPDGQIAPALARFLSSRRPAVPGEACEICATPVPEAHRHVVDLERRGMLCACQACSLLFMTDDATAGRYRTVPDRHLRVEPLTLPGQAWTALQIPVGMAFVVDNSGLGRTVAFYPSPGGATESELPLDAWAEVVAANQVLAQVEPDVEAVLLRTGTGLQQGFVVPVDRCYELVGVLRLHWRGFDGGQEVREHIAAFFADVERRVRQ